MDKELPLCECGCGKRVAKKGNRFINGHPRRGKLHTPEAKKKMSDSRTGVSLSPEHCASISAAQRDVPKSPEHGLAMSKARLGVPNTPEHNATISKAHTDVPLSPEHSAAIKNSVSHKASQDRQRGGFDIVKHHHIYDHDDLSKYTIEMTRSQHSTLHLQMHYLNIQVPHINTGHENIEELELMEYIKKIETTEMFICNHVTRR